MEKICGIYCIENVVNGKKYVGQSVDIYIRWRKEKNILNKDTKAWNAHLQNAWKKYGEQNFRFYILEECDEKMLDDREIYWISYYHTYVKDSNCMGYNCTICGKDVLWKNPWNKGTVCSEEHKSKIRRSMKKYVDNHPERIELLNKIRANYWSDETNRVKRSKKMLERYKNKEERDKQRDISLKLWESHDYRKKQKNGMANSKIAKPVICIETGEKFSVCSDAMRWLGKNPKSCNMILKVCRGESESAFGYHWKFANRNIESGTSNESVSNTDVCY